MLLYAVENESCTIDQDTATGPVARPPRPAEKTGRGGEPDGRTRRRNRPDPAGCGAWQTLALPRPLASGRCGRPRCGRPGPMGSVPRRGRLFCSLTIRSFVTQPSVVVALFHLHERGTLEKREIVTGRRPRRVARRSGRRHRTSHPLRRSRRARKGRARPRIGVVKSPRARGGCLGVIRTAGVEGCDMSGGAAQHASIPECPLNTRGTETSQYPEEEKATATPSVAASERGPA
jgi:hypothetical protein